MTPIFPESPQVRASEKPDSLRVFQPQPTLFQTLRASEKPDLPRVLQGPTTTRIISQCDPSENVKKYFSSLSHDFLKLEPRDNKGSTHDAGVKKKQPIASGTGDASCRHVDTQPASAAVGIVLCGDPSPAAGTHNVVLGLRDWLRSTGAKLYGFLDGPRGLILGGQDNFIDFSAEESSYVDSFLNQGGAYMLNYGKCRLLSDRDATKIKATCDRLKINGLCFVGGLYELSQIAVLAQRFADTDITILGVIQSPNGSAYLKDYISITLGFDSARGVLCEMAGNLCLETMSGSEYHFVICGSGAVTLEVALQITPTMCFINAEVRHSKKTLNEIIRTIVDTLDKRRERGKHAAVVLLSEGFFESLYHMEELKNDIALLRREKAASLLTENDAEQFLEGESLKLFTQLPYHARHGLVFLSDHSGLPVLPSISAEREIGALVQAEVLRRGQKSLNMCFHNLGQEGRCPVPTRFDSAMGWALGHVTGHLLSAKKHGYIAAVEDLLKPVEEWTSLAVPFTALLKDSGERGPPTMPQARVSLESTIFKVYEAVSTSWPLQSSYRQPGPTQHFSPPSLDDLPYSLIAQYWNFPGVLEHVRGVGEVPEDDIILPESPPIHCPRRKLDGLSILQRSRIKYEPQLPKCLLGRYHIRDAEISGHMYNDLNLLKMAFPHSVHSASSSSHHLRSVELERIDDDDGDESKSSQEDEKSDFLPEPGSMKVKEKGNLLLALDRRLRSKERGLGLHPQIIIGLAFLGRPSPGTLNIALGLHAYLQSMPTPGRLIGILMGGIGVQKEYYIELNEETLEAYKNQGGLDLLGRSEKTVTRSSEELEWCSKLAKNLRLDGLVIVGGVGTHADTAMVSEYFLDRDIPCRVIGVPASIEGDIPFVEQTLGFDTASKVYASIVGNLATDAATAGRTWYFIRIAGRSVSHIAAECALQTNPNIVLVSEEIQSRRLSLSDVTNMICDNVETRAKNGKNFGVVLIPEGFLSFVPEVRLLITEVNQLKKIDIEVSTAVDLKSYLTAISYGVFQHLPERIQQQVVSILHLPRETSTRLEVNNLETESLMKALVESELNRRKVLGSFRSGSFLCRTHSLAHQGRSALPTNFDCDLGYTMGYASGALIDGGKTGFLVAVANLKKNVSEWQVSGIPLTSLISLSSHPYDPTKLRVFLEAGMLLLEGRKFAHQLPPPTERIFRNPGPVQFFGPAQHLVCKRLEMTNDRSARLKKIWKLCKDLKRLSSANCGPVTLDALITSLRSSLDLLKAVAAPQID